MASALRESADHVHTAEEDVFWARGLYLAILDCFAFWAVVAAALYAHFS